MITPATIDELLALRTVMRSVAGPATAHDEYNYRHIQRHGELHSVLTGHCLTVAHLVWRRYGGQVVHGMVGGRWHLERMIDGAHHVWNRLDGEDLDLTSDQFETGDGWHLAPRSQAMYTFEPAVLHRYTRLPHMRVFRQLVEAAEAQRWEDAA